MLKQLTLSLSLCALSLSVLASAPKPVDVPEVTVTTEQGKGKTTEALVKNDKAAVDALVGKLEAIRTLSARFNQESLQENGRSQSQSGEIQLKRPNMYRWLTREPYSQEIISRDGRVWNIDNDLMQAVIQEQDLSSQNTPVQLLSGNARDFLKDYNVTRVSAKGDETYSLRPTAGNDLFELLEIHFKQNQLSALFIKDSLGGKRRIELKQVNTNGMISSSRFKARIPKGYDVIDETKGYDVIKETRSRAPEE
ncbi:outer membrane lipoprotein chaperone LolA [Endozoicomonas sp. Mp262]|uniref:outer membrane lipoprotein chaperone LolA n=1 Tax=Endozoicomonas sp. Mp262 TaxID=2919499 RepID=UPI0021DB1E6F